MKKSSATTYWLGFFLALQLTGFPIRQLNAQQSPPTVPPSTPEKKALLEVLIELNRTRGAYFLFSQPQMGKTLVTPPNPSANASIEKILNQLLRNTGLGFKKVDEQTFVILRRKKFDLTADSAVNNPLPYEEEDAGSLPSQEAPSGTVGGRIIDREGKVLQGVSVSVRNTHRGTVTDLAGEFMIKAGNDDMLILSFVGYSNREIPAGLAGKAPIVLTASDQPLAEVLVTALGINKQEKSLGYSTSEVDGTAFTQSREVNLGNALTGQVAGVTVMQNATGPYGSSRVLIRGNASLSGNNQPLYVVDGVPFDNANQGSSGQWGGADLGDGLSNINPDDIESVVVLKGVAASALYGYRGGNGAILVTTKSGSKTQGLGVQVNNNFTANRVIDERDYQYVYGQGVSGVKPGNTGVAQSASYFSWGAPLDGSKAVNYLGDTYAYRPARNNFKNYFQTGITNQSSIALTGANNKGHFRLGISDLYLNTIVPNSSMTQQGLNFNSTFFITNKLQMDLKADYVFEQVNNRASLSDAPGNVMAAPLYLANSFDIRWMKDRRVLPDGTEWLPGTTDPYFENPYYIAYEYQNTTNRNRLTGGLTLRYNLLDWLYVQGQLSRDGYLFNVTQIVPSGVEYTRTDGMHGGNLTQYEVNFHEMNSGFMIGANKKFGGNWTFAVNAGGNQQDNVNNVDGIGDVPGSGDRPAGPFIVAGDYSQGNVRNKSYSAIDKHYRVNSLFASADLAYRNFLFFTATARNDWFSTLNIQTDAYLYPSLSTSFVFSDVLRLPAWFTLGKLRASYAGSSNGTTPYQNMLTYGLQGYTVDSAQVGYVATNGVIPDAFLRPVSISEVEFGASLHFLQDRLGLDVSFYDKTTTNDIVNVTVSPTSGYTQKVENIGKVRNKGIELGLTATPVRSANFKWNLAFNLAINSNKVLYLGGLPSIVINGAYPRWGSEVSISNVVGMPYGQIMGFGYKRDKDGHILFSDGVSNPAPAGEPEQTGLIPLGSTTYKQTGGLTNEFHYRNFALSFLIDFRFGAKLYSGTNLLLYYYGLSKATLPGRQTGFVGKGILENGHANNLPVPSQQYFQDISASGTDHIAEEFVYDASFIKLRALSLAYSVPAKWLKKKFIKEMSFSVVGRNLAILLKHVPNVDPESSINNTNGQGLEGSGYPAVRNLGCNLSLRF
ncbi:SusC/RagA family TonB-linked outer membrane protein [Puia sp.]|jgi:TonB-linked SusC/RagA family outer membrane protein|uniref:SusC/RagA family TonB-linked outer membrane protein n=1 Tax=Puia sp. TaxID=2045100 RepID=UPI002F4101AD